MSFTFNGLDIGDKKLAPLDTKASPGVAVPLEKPEPDNKVSHSLMAQNRAYRRQFKHKHGVFLPGSTRPVINKKEKK